MLKRFLFVLCAYKSKSSHNIFFEFKFFNYKRLDIFFGLSPFLNHSNDEKYKIKTYLIAEILLYENLSFFTQFNTSKYDKFNINLGICIKLYKFKILIGGFKKQITIQCKFPIHKNISILYIFDHNFKKPVAIINNIKKDYNLAQIENMTSCNPIINIAKDLNKETEFWHQFIQGKHAISMFGAILAKDKNNENSQKIDKLDTTLLDMVYASKIICSNIFNIPYKGKYHNNEEVIEQAKKFKEIKLKRLKSDQTILQVLIQIKSHEEVQNILNKDEDLKDYKIENDKAIIEIILLRKLNNMKNLLNLFAINIEIFQNLNLKNQQNIQNKIKSIDKKNSSSDSDEIETLFNNKNAIFTLANSKMKQLYAGISLGKDLASLLMQVDSAINCIYHHKNGTKFKGQTIDFAKAKHELNLFKIKVNEYKLKEKKEVDAKDIIKRLINNGQNISDNKLLKAMKESDKKFEFLKDYLNSPFKNLNQEEQNQIINELVQAFNDCVVTLFKLKEDQFKN